MEHHSISEFKMESYKVTDKICVIVKETFPFELGCSGLHVQNPLPPFPRKTFTSVCP